MFNIRSQQNKLIPFIAAIVMMTQMVFAQTSTKVKNENIISDRDSNDITYYKILPLNNVNRKKLIDIATTFFMNDKNEYLQKKSYVLEGVDETNIDYQVSFFHKNHPKGILGSAPGMPTYTVHIDKVTFKVIKRSFGR